MEIRFWGVRGSIASPGPMTARVGGNTSCVEVRTAEAHLVLDAGTGLRHLGEALLARGAPVDTTVLLSHYACVDPALKALAEGADVLICDAQYTPEEYRGDGGRSRVGWGHSTYAAAAEVARAAGVKELVLFHHDPTRTDDAVDDVEARTRALFAATVAAREGMVITVDAFSRAA